MTRNVDPAIETVRMFPSVRMGIFGVVIAAMSFLLNHSMRAAGFNLSFADPFLIVLVCLLLFTSRLYILRYSFIFFSALVVLTLSTTLVFTSLILGIQPNFNVVLGDLTKLIISFLYFVVGTSVAKMGIQNHALKWFAIGAVGVALLGVGMEILGVRFFENILYFGDFRFRGFMSDPNFYSVLACSAFAYFSYAPGFPRFMRVLVLFVLAFSVILSGSKTGMVALVTLCTVILVTRATESKKMGSTFFLAFSSIMVLVFFNPIRRALSEMALQLGQYVPQFERTALLLSDNPLESISGDGSSRDAMWSVGIQIIEMSPVFGIGIGTYNSVSMALFSQRGVAHNTYLQLAAEWGLVFALILFGWITFLLIRSTLGRNKMNVFLESIILRDIIIVFLIGSASLSLNNARMLWFFLGMLAYICYSRKLYRRENELGG